MYGWQLLLGLQIIEMIVGDATTDGDVASGEEADTRESSFVVVHKDL
jgi:hypothetical protein